MGALATFGGGGGGGTALPLGTASDDEKLVTRLAVEVPHQREAGAPFLVRRSVGRCGAGEEEAGGFREKAGSSRRGAICLGAPLAGLGDGGGPTAGAFCLGPLAGDRSSEGRGSPAASRCADRGRIPMALPP